MIIWGSFVIFQFCIFDCFSNPISLPRSP